MFWWLPLGVSSSGVSTCPWQVLCLGEGEYSHLLRYSPLSTHAPISIPSGRDIGSGILTPQKGHRTRDTHPLWTDRHLRKHYFHVTLLAGGNKEYVNKAINRRHHCISGDGCFVIHMCDVFKVCVSKPRIQPYTTNSKSKSQEQIFPSMLTPFRLNKQNGK